MREWLEKDEAVQRDEALERMARQKGEVCEACREPLSPEEFGNRLCGYCQGKMDKD
jgi:methionyl-tRNA synthetase